MQGTNPDSQWRFNIARQVACIYAQNRDTTAIMVDGSAGRGHTDRISDIEIGVFWHKPPTEATRARVVERAGADLIRLYPFFKNEQVWCDDYMVGWPKSKQPQSSLLTEVTHHTAESMQGTLDSVLLSPNPDLVKQKTDLWCLGGDPHLRCSSGIRMEITRSNNRMMLYQAFFQVQIKLLPILLALNRQYYAGFKWLDLMIERMDLKPKNFAERLKRSYHLNPSKGDQLLADLVEETYDLIETHLPEIDIGWLRRVFRYQRPILDQEPKHHPIFFTKGLSDDI